MADLPGNECQILAKACILRMARLGPDCAPLDGENNLGVTDGIISLSADPDVEEGTTIEPTNGCGSPLALLRDPDIVKRYNVSGEVGYADWPQLELLFGGEVLLGAEDGDFAEEAIGWAPPSFPDTPYDGVYLEVIMRNVGRDSGECGGATGTPYATGMILGRAKLSPGEVNAQNEHVQIPFSGVAEPNPQLGDGPFDDAPIEGGLRRSPVQYVAYSLTEYQAIESMVACGYQPVAS